MRFGSGSNEGEPVLPKEKIMNFTSKSTKDAAPVATGEILDCEVLTGLYVKRRGASGQNAKEIARNRCSTGCRGD